MHFFLAFALTIFSMAQATAIERAAETHNVKLINNCGSGRPVFFYQGNTTPQSSTTVHGPLLGGIAWVDGLAGHNCLMSGVNCGIVEFTLTNSGRRGMQNAADYSLLDGRDPQTGVGLGNHHFTYPMNFRYTSPVNAGPGRCTGYSHQACPGAFLGSATTGGAPYQVLADNVGIEITFC